MMRFRLLLAWLIVAAIPLQGLAASSMLYCGQGEHHGPAQVAFVQGNQESVSSTTGAMADHSSHQSAAVADAEKTSDSAGKKMPVSVQKCVVCASCCSFLAISVVPQLALFSPAEQAEFTESFVLFQIRPSQVPDKPPRA